MTPREVLRAAGRGVALTAVTGAEVGQLLVRERWLDAHPTVRAATVRRWSGEVLDALGVRVQWVRRPSLAEGFVPGGRMVVSSHRSMVDIWVLLHTFGGHLLSRADLASWPVIGKLAPLAGTLFVDRTSATSGAAALRAMSEKLHEGKTLGVFAEGTTYPDDVVRPFQPGAFAAVSRSGGEVVPVGMAYAGKHATYFQEPFGAHAKRLLLADETLVAVAVGEPMKAAGRSIRALTQETHDAVQSLVDEARRSL